MKRRFDLEAGESIVDEWVAGLPSRSGRTATHGGTLVLTTHRLIWEALRLPPGLDQMVGGPFLDRLTSGVPLGEVLEIHADERRPCMLHIRTGNGEARFLISASRWCPIWSRKNRVARDDAVGRIRSLIGG